MTRCPWIHGLWPKKAVPPVPVRFLINDHLPRVSRQSANVSSGNMVKAGAVHRYPGIYLTANENLEKPQLGGLR